jgi:predicted NodU family carbamoyl transferase
MEEILEKLLEAVEFGKVDKKSPFPPQLKGQDGSHELTISAIENGIKPKQILENALIPAMERVGKKFSEKEIRQAANRYQAVYEHITDFDALAVRVAAFLNNGKVIGWFQGRMEFGPRSLGNRSILGDARTRKCKNI